MAEQIEREQLEPAAEVHGDSWELFQRVRGGDRGAFAILCRRYMPALRRWAHGRLPRAVRDIEDTEDLVQTAFMRAFDRSRIIELQADGSLLAYLRTIVLNEIRAQLRRSARRPARSVTENTLPDPEGGSILDLLINDERTAAYQQALEELTPRQREVVVLRLEFGMTFPEIGKEMGSSQDAARTTTSRALAALARRLGTQQPSSETPGES